MKNIYCITTLLIFSTISYAGTCAPGIYRIAPDSRYEVIVGSGGAEILDKQTKLIWQRCSIGQVWNGTTCTGVASTHTWTDALAQAKAIGHGYRLPNIKELLSLVEEADCGPNAINETMFPATPNRQASPSSDGYYWSSSPYKNQPINNPTNYSAINNAWSISFGYGGSFSDEKSNSKHVRAVRNGY